MSILPPELYDSIVDHIDDVGCLKSCSLAASALRYPSQRLLFSCLSVDDQSYVGHLKLLSDSPHIGGFVTFLRIRALFHNNMGKLDVDSDPLLQILDKLANVRRCFVDSLWYLTPGPSVPERSQLPDFLINFLNRRSLRELSLRGFKTASAVVLQFATTIQKLQFTSMGTDDEFDCTEAVNSVERAVLADLSLMNAGDIGRLLTHPQSLPCLAALRNLSISSDRECGGELIAATSRTLELIHFDRLSHLIPQALEECIAEAIIVLSTLVGLDTTSPAVREVNIQQRFTRGGVFDPLPYETLFQLLDEALAVYATPPRIRLTLVFTLVSGHEMGTPFRSFAEAARYKMPRAQSTGRLVVERYAFATSKALFWVSNLRPFCRPEHREIVTRIRTTPEQTGGNFRIDESSFIR
ncbi:hypothetical protein R3P38DRAFT_3468683 [Favolaschia claudopus]|uniref:F-box domain-containing protein n=1 Tax=Favolaschia claudopus TaxID=2862362 RepID=A0AAW0CNC8_9AGAR